MLYLRIIALLVAAGACALGQTGAVNIVGGTVDLSGASHTLPVKVVTIATLPATCTTGEQAIASDAAPGANLYICTSTNNFSAVSGTAAPPPTPGYQPNQLLAGCGVEYVSGLTYTVGACTYTIAGVTYQSAITSVTLAAADPANPRIDVIYVDVTGSVLVLTGTPAATPAAPTIDPSTQLGLTFATVAANATVPSNTVATLIYDENVEWTCTPTTNLNCASTSNPYHGTHDIEATTAVLGNNVTLVKPAAGTVDLGTQNFLVFYIRSKAVWPTGKSGANAARFLSLFWLNGATQVGQQVVLQSGAFGFNSSTTTSYQQVSIPVGLFQNAGQLVTTLEVKVSGPSGTSSIGFYLDEITLQSGISQFTLPVTLVNFKGTWNATTSYNVNDMVVSGNTSYVALKASTNVAVATAATWQQLAAAGVTSVNTNTGAVTLFNVNAQTATYQVVAADFTQCKTIVVSSGTFNITLVASGSQPASGQCVRVLNYGTGVVTLVRSGQNINGAAANLTGTAGSATAPTGWEVYSDGTNYAAFVIGGGAGVTISGTYFSSGGNSYSGFPLIAVTQPPATGSFTGNNTTGLTFTNLAGGSEIFMQGSSNGGLSAQSETTAAPATPWTRTITVYPSLAPTNFGMIGGIFWDGNATGKGIICGLIWDSNWHFQAYTLANVTSVTATAVGTAAIYYPTTGLPITVVLGDDGTNLSCKLSLDNGQTILGTFYSASETAFFPAKPTNVGLVAYENGTAPGGVIVGYK